MLDRLPTEILQEITETLNPTTQYHLTLTSQSIHNITQPFLTKSSLNHHRKNLPSLVYLDNPIFQDRDPRENTWFYMKRQDCTTRLQSIDGYSVSSKMGGYYGKEKGCYFTGKNLGGSWNSMIKEKSKL